jgi:hypothetical protein
MTHEMCRRAGFEAPGDTVRALDTSQAIPGRPKRSLTDKGTVGALITSFFVVVGSPPRRRPSHEETDANQDREPPSTRRLPRSRSPLWDQPGHLVFTGASADLTTRRFVVGSTAVDRQFVARG